MPSSSPSYSLSLYLLKNQIYNIVNIAIKVYKDTHRHQYKEIDKQNLYQKQETDKVMIEWDSSY